MPRSSRSPLLTSQYRSRLAAIRSRVESTARAGWPSIETLDGSPWVERTAQAVARAQTEAVRSTSGFLTAYVSSELGRRVRVVPVDSRRYAGLSRDGRPLTESLRSPLVGVLAALKDGKPADEALRIGWNRAQRMVEMDVMHAARSSLLDAIEADDRIDGWQRATAGTCGACMALAGTTADDFLIHPGCQCQPQPVVKGVPDRIPILRGMELFKQWSREKQDRVFGPDKAEAIRTGLIELDDLIDRSRLKRGQDFITEAPLDAAE